MTKRQGERARAGRKSPTRRSPPSTTISPRTTTTSCGSATCCPKLERHGLRGQRLLDVACGTGKSFIPMLARGWEVTGCDISPAMVELARGQGRRRGATSPSPTCASCPRFGEFDLVWCLDDAVNYLLSTEELERALVGMRRNLGPERAADVRRQRAQRLPHLLRRRSGGRARRAAAGLEGPQLAGCRSRARSPKRASRSSRSTARGRRSQPRCTASATSPKPRCWPRSSGPAWSASTSIGHGYDAVPKQPLDEAEHTKAIYISRAARSR